MSKNGYLATMPWSPDSKLEEPHYAEPDINSVIEILRNHGNRLSHIEERIEDLLTNGTSSRLLSGDPPCEICGQWTTGRLCPSCERKFSWF